MTSSSPPRSQDSGITFTLVHHDGSKDQEHKLRPGETMVGRATSCDLVINDASVSRAHARFDVSDGRCILTDLNSSNGTFVNEAQVDKAPVGDGDRVVLGSVRFTIHRSAPHDVVLSDSADLPNSIVSRPADEFHTAAATPSQIEALRPLRMLSDISRTLVGGQPLEEVLAHVTDLAFASTRAERALLLFYEESTKALVPRVVRYRTGARKSTTLSRTILDRVMRERVSILAVDAQAGLDTSQSIVALDIQSFMCAPLWYEREIIGVLYVDVTRKSRLFTEADLDLFTAFSNYAAVAIAQARLLERVADEVRRRERLARYHSPAVVERILDRGGEAEETFLAQEREVTVLFGDIVGFTSIAERMPPQQVAVLLNAFFTRMSDAIFQFDGTLDKFIGDSVLGIFGAPLSLPNHALNAVRAAVRMQESLAELRRERPDPRLEMRVAIHTGIALIGDIGSPTRREFSVLGDVVNTASRIEESVAQANQIVITRATCDQIAGELPTRPLGFAPIRGRAEGVEVFEVVLDAN
jgi:adenylate cyclase